MTGPGGSVASVRYTGSTGGTSGRRIGTTISPAAAITSAAVMRPGRRTRRSKAATANPDSTANPNATINPKRAGARSQANIGTAVYSAEYRYAFGPNDAQKASTTSPP